MTQVKVHRHTNYEITEGETSFAVEFEPVEGSPIIQINGDKATVGYLSPDGDSTFDWYFDEMDSGEFHNIGDRDCKKFERMGVEEIMDLVRENPRRCFWIAKYEHSLSRYYRTGEAITLKSLRAREHPGTASAAGYCVPDQQWDVSPGVAIFVVPDDAGKPYSKYCDAVMEEFTDWCNGSIYGVCTQKFTRNEDGSWEPDESDECWQFIGYQHATESLKEEMKGGN